MKPLRILNERTGFLGLSVLDLGGIGYFLIFTHSLLELINLELLAFLFSGILAIVLIQIRLTQRPKIIRDFVKYYLFSKKINLSGKDMLPKLKSIIEVDDLSFWQTTDGKVGTGFEMQHCDLEVNDPSEYSLKLTALIKSMSPNILGRVHLRCFKSNDFNESVSRSKEISKLGFKENRVAFYLNYLGDAFDFKNLKNLFKEKTDFSKEVQALLELKKTIENSGFNIKPINRDEVERLFDINYDLIKTVKTIESSTESIGIIRLIKQSPKDVDLTSLPKMINNLSDFEISISFKKLSESYAKLILEKRIKQLSSQNDISSELQLKETEDSILNQFSRGTQLVEFEFLVILKRASQEKLLKDLSTFTVELNKFSDFKIENYGLAESFIAAHPASNQHVTLLESDEVLPAFIPLFSYSDTRNSISKRSLTLTRENGSLSHFDLFNPSYNCFNTLVVGTSGKGKSVLTGLLTKALLNDPNVNVIKVDVGGSHSKECELLSGAEYKLRLDEASGINPFLILKSSASNSETIDILSKFLSVLILETGEADFSKDIKSQIEDSVLEYINIKPQNPSLEDFYLNSKSFPRRSLLKRWVKGGVYEAAFKDSEKESSVTQRLRYYNFSQIFNAADPEFSKAGIAAVLAQFNIDAIEANGKRIVLICDETPFFIKTCFDFFSFSTANVRKYGHAVVLICQLSSQLVVDGKTNIIDNSPQRFIFSIDGKPQDFKERLNLNDDQFESVESLSSVPGVSSEVVLQSGHSAKKLIIKITPEEYWALTTSQTDQLKIQKLKAAVPELSLEEALKCLSIV